MLPRHWMGALMEICGACNGSGEGRFDGTTCHECRGWGEVPSEELENEEEITADFQPSYLLLSLCRPG